MATVHVITKKERKAKARSRFTLVCTGLSKTEFRDLHRVFNTEFGCKTVLPNPFPPEFDAKAVHQLIAYVRDSALGLYAAKKAIDTIQELFVSFVKFKFMTPPEDGRVRRVQLYCPNGEMYEFKDKKRELKKK
jgi:hypothetical protein